MPEVETIRRHLAPHLEGRVLETLDVHDERWSRPLAGERARRRRRGPARGGARPARQVPDLRARGRRPPDRAPADDGDAPARPAGAAAPRPRAFGFSGGRRLVFDDPRRFGTGELALGTPAREAFFAPRLGVEPFSPDFTSAHLYALTRASRAPVKAFLLDQRKVAGVGNIYADEALFRARIHPLRPASRLTRGQVRRAARRGGRGAGGGRRGEGRLDRRLPPPRRRPGLLPGPLPHPPARGRAVPRTAGGPCASCARPGAGPTSARSASRGRRVRPRRAARPAGRRGRPPRAPESRPAARRR